MTTTSQPTGPASRGMEQSHQTMHPVDLVHLAKYTMGDTVLEAEILSLFARQSEVYFGQLEKAASAKEWHAAAHTLKGSARSVGAFQIADLAEQAEKIEDPCSSDEKQLILQTLRAELSEAVDYIQSLLENQST